MQRSSIEWTEATWNPVTGCKEISPGCAHCYAKTFAERFRGVPGHPYENGFDLQLRPERLSQPLRWKKPRTIFVNSMSDLFHEDVPDDYVREVFEVMRIADHHRFQVLTKRSERLAELAPSLPWPSNVWMGVSVENQRFVSRIDDLRQVPAAVRFLSCEPLLGELNLDLEGIDWVIAGGESGPRARPMRNEWAMSVLEQCINTGTPFFFKQWGAHDAEGNRVGKKKAGRSFNGRLRNDVPKGRTMPREYFTEQDSYGGDWTITKLENLSAYADAYTTVLKNQPFDLIYFDAFAGEGSVAIKSGGHAGEVVDGSATVAVNITGKPFDELRFVEQKPEVATRLREKLQLIASNRITTVEVGDANEVVLDFCAKLGDFQRALVLLDPFATEVSWPTVQALAETKKCDVLILFPTMPLRRMLKRFDDPQDARFARQMERIYGNDSWKSLYRQRQQPSLFSSDPKFESAAGADALVALYKQRLNEVFVDSISQSLKNKTNSRMFEFIVAWGDPKGAKVGRRIASWIISNKSPFRRPPSQPRK